MVDTSNETDKSVIVYGAGISGCGAAEVLAEHGPKVFL